MRSWALYPAMAAGWDEAGAVESYLNSGWMAGGNYATGDSRFGELVDSYSAAIAVHDRREWDDPRAVTAAQLMREGG